MCARDLQTVFMRNFSTLLNHPEACRECIPSTFELASKTTGCAPSGSSGRRARALRPPAIVRLYHLILTATVGAGFCSATAVVNVPGPETGRFGRLLPDRARTKTSRQIVSGPAFQDVVLPIQYQFPVDTPATACC